MKNRFSITTTLGSFYNLIDNFQKDDPKFITQFSKEELIELKKKIDILLAEAEDKFEVDYCESTEVCFCQHALRPEDCNICSPDTGWM